jgi:hypothetical protein
MSSIIVSSGGQSGQGTQTFGVLASTTWDLSTGAKKTLLLNANKSITVTNLSAGTSEGLLVVSQDATGSRTLTINGQVVTINATGKTTIGFLHDGESLLLYSSVGGASGGGGTSSSQLSIPSLSLTVIDDTHINAVVGSVANASSYQVQRSLDNTSWTTIATTAGTYNDSGLPSGTLVYYRARAIGDGTTYTNSNYAFANATTQGATYSAETTAFAGEVFSNGVSLSSAEKSALDTLISSLKTAGVWTKMKAIYPFVGASLDSFKVNLKAPGSYTWGYFTGTPSVNGLQGNGTSDTVNTGFNMATELTWPSGYLGFYSRTNNLTGNQVVIGGSTTSPAMFSQINITGGNGIMGSLGVLASFTPTDTRGYFSASRTAGNSLKVYRNGATVASNTTADTGSFPNTFINILGRNGDNTSTQLFSLHQCAFAVIGDGLTDSEETATYTAIQAFQTSLNRAV